LKFFSTKEKGKLLTGLDTREILIQDRISSVLSSIILRHLHPRSLIQLVVQVLEPGEPSFYTCRELATAINSAVVALIDAAVPLQGVVIATSLVITTDGEYVFDPDQDILNSNDVKSDHVIGYEMANGHAERLLLCESNGSFTEEQLFEALSKASDQCEGLYKNLRSVIGESVQQKFIWKQ
jgi:exosome complex component RRP46